MRLLLVLIALTQLSDGWQYAHTTPRATPPAVATWSDEARESRQYELWYRVPLPDPLPRDAHLVFRSYGAELDLFVDQQRVYSFGDVHAGGRLRLHSVPISRGRFLFVRVPRGARLPLFGGTPMLVAGDEVPLALVRAATSSLREGVSEIVIAAILIIIGIACAAVSRVRRGSNASALSWFGVFSALYGARLIADSALPLLLGASMRHMQFAEAWITAVIPIPGWLMARSLIGEGWRRSLRWQIVAFALFAPIYIIYGLVTGVPDGLEAANNALVIIGGTNILVNLFLTRRQHTRELRVVLAGSVVFMLFALANNLAALTQRHVDETPGFVVFVIALGYASVRMFARGERERVALEGELATAREIQRSILPSSMPAIEGLRFAARYEPASSVAGDLYDFVPSTSGTGLIVADVAGHGVPAALIASMMKVAVSSHARLADDPSSLLRELNATLRRDVRRNFVTATYLFFDAGAVVVSNAGHPPPLLVRGDAVRELGPHGVLLGRFAVTSYGSESIELQPGDRIAAFTDGIIEARNARDETFGEERLHALLRSGATPDTIVEDVLRWRAKDADDLTIVTVEVT